jgi:hypothetical protein
VIFAGSGLDVVALLPDGTTLWTERFYFGDTGGGPAMGVDGRLYITEETRLLALLP